MNYRDSHKLPRKALTGSALPCLLVYNLNGFNFWLAKLNQFNGNFVQAEMVKAFIKSTEYRGRFGPP